MYRKHSRDFPPTMPCFLNSVETRTSSVSPRTLIEVTYHRRRLYPSSRHTVSGLTIETKTHIMRRLEWLRHRGEKGDRTTELQFSLATFTNGRKIVLVNSKVFWFVQFLYDWVNDLLFEKLDEGKGSYSWRLFIYVFFYFRFLFHYIYVPVSAFVFVSFNLFALYWWH